MIFIVVHFEGHIYIQISTPSVTIGHTHQMHL